MRDFSALAIYIELTVLRHMYVLTCTGAIYTYMHGQLYLNMQELTHMHCLEKTTDEEQNSSQSLLHMQCL